MEPTRCALQIRTGVLNDNPRRRPPALVSRLHPHRRQDQAHGLPRFVPLSPGWTPGRPRRSVGGRRRGPAPSRPGPGWSVLRSTRRAPSDSSPTGGSWRLRALFAAEIRVRPGPAMPDAARHHADETPHHAGETAVTSPTKPSPCRPRRRFPSAPSTMSSTADSTRSTTAPAISTPGTSQSVVWPSVNVHARRSPVVVDITGAVDQRRRQGRRLPGGSRIGRPGGPRVMEFRSRSSVRVKYSLRCGRVWAIACTDQLMYGRSVGLRAADLPTG